MAKLSQREIEVCRRLRIFRELMKISRSKFALEIGISSDRIASYEFARAPLRYGVYQAIQKRFFISPLWLATGETSPVYGEIFDDSSFFTSIRADALFTDVYDEHLTKLIGRESMLVGKESHDFLVKLNRFFAKGRVIMEIMDRDPIFAGKVEKTLDAQLRFLKKNIELRQRARRLSAKLKKKQ